MYEDNAMEFLTKLDREPIARSVYKKDDQKNQNAVNIELTILNSDQE